MFFKSICAWRIDLQYSISNLLVALFSLVYLDRFATGSINSFNSSSWSNSGIIMRKILDIPSTDTAPAPNSSYCLNNFSNPASPPNKNDHSYYRNDNRKMYTCKKPEETYRACTPSSAFPPVSIFLKWLFKRPVQICLIRMLSQKLNGG